MEEPKIGILGKGLIMQVPTMFSRGSFPRCFNPLPDDKILDWSKLKQFADDNYKFDENSRKFSKQVENTVGKGEIACYEQFLLFPQCFQKACFPGASKGVIVWEWVKSWNFVQLGFCSHVLKQFPCNP